MKRHRRQLLGASERQAPAEERAAPREERRVIQVEYFRAKAASLASLLGRRRRTSRPEASKKVRPRRLTVDAASRYSIGTRASGAMYENSLP